MATLINRRDFLEAPAVIFVTLVRAWRNSPREIAENSISLFLRAHRSRRHLFPGEAEAEVPKNKIRWLPCLSRKLGRFEDFAHPTLEPLAAVG